MQVFPAKVLAVCGRPCYPTFPLGNTGGSYVPKCRPDPRSATATKLDDKQSVRAGATGDASALSYLGFLPRSSTGSGLRIGLKGRFQDGAVLPLFGLKGRFC